MTGCVPWKVVLLATASLALLSSAHAVRSHPQARFPNPIDDHRPSSLAENPLTKLVWGEARTHNGTKLHVLHTRCFSSNNQTCSGHGVCRKSGASTFGTADVNVRRYYCACHAHYFGKACQLTFRDAQDRRMLRHKLLRVLRSARAGHTSSDTPDGIPRKPDDPGSVFWRLSPDYNGVKVKGVRPTGIIADKYQPTSNGVLERWAVPDEHDLFSGSGMLAQWQRERLTVQIVPDEYLKRKIRPPKLRRSKFAYYMNDNGRIIKGPAVYAEQEMPWEPDPTMPSAAAASSPGATPFLNVLNGLPTAANASNATTAAAGPTHS